LVTFNAILIVYALSIPIIWRKHKTYPGIGTFLILFGGLIYLLVVCSASCCLKRPVPLYLISSFLYGSIIIYLFQSSRQRKWADGFGDNVSCHYNIPCNSSLIISRFAHQFKVKNTKALCLLVQPKIYYLSLLCIIIPWICKFSWWTVRRQWYALHSTNKYLFIASMFLLFRMYCVFKISLLCNGETETTYEPKNT